MKRTCSSCGNPIRDGADFCSSCGAAAPQMGTNPAATGEEMLTTVPLITLAPHTGPISKKRMIRYGKMVAGVVAVLVIALAAAAVAAWISTDPFKTSAFEEVETDSYRECLALVNEVRNSNFDDIIDDLINMEGAAEDYNFLQRYEQLLKERVPDDADPTAVKFRNCCYMVLYTEFTAKKFKSYSDRGLLGLFYVDDADLYRNHADTLWGMLSDAQSDAELQAIIDYCAENDIIYLKNTTQQPAQQETVTEDETQQN